MDAEIARELEDLSKKVGRLKGVHKLYQEARKKGIDVTKAQVKDFVEGIGQKQVLSQSQPSLGQSATTTIAKEGSRFQCDLLQIRFSAQEAETDEEDDEEKKRYALMIINVFDRKLHAVTLATKSSEAVMSGMRKLLRKMGNDMKGGVLSSDMGREFFNDDFQKLLKTHDIAWKSKGNGEPNAISVLDRAIGTIRKDVSARMMEEPGKTWNQVLGASLVAYNRAIHGTMRDAPNDVGKEPILQYLQISDNAKKYAHNNALAKKRVVRVKELGAFRRPKGKAKAFKRGFEATWGDKQDLEEVTDATLLKAQGDPRLIDVKSVLPVPVATDTRAERIARPGAMDRRRKAKTEDIIAFLNNYLDVGETRALTSVGRWLRAQMEDGLYDATLKSINRNLAGVLEMWSNKFELKERGRNYYVKRLR